MRLNPTRGNMYEWVSHTWSPVVGCPHQCSYCYVRTYRKLEEKVRLLPGKFPDLGYDRTIFVAHMADLFAVDVANSRWASRPRSSFTPSVLRTPAASPPRRGRAAPSKKRRKKLQSEEGCESEFAVDQDMVTGAVAGERRPRRRALTLLRALRHWLTPEEVAAWALALAITLTLKCCAVTHVETPGAFHHPFPASGNERNP